METKFITWNNLMLLATWLVVFYGTLIIISYIITHLTKKTLTTKKILNYLSKIILLYKPIAFSILLIGFISVNYIIHTTILLAIGVVFFRHVRNYIHGIFLKMNPLMKKGAILKFGDSEGELKKFLPFGAILSTEKGEFYFTYEMLEQKGFLVKSNNQSTLRHTLFLITTSFDKATILDFLFDNPLLDFSEKPSIKVGEITSKYILQYTLENGATTEDLVSFFETKKIQATKINSKI